MYRQTSGLFDLDDQFRFAGTFGENCIFGEKANSDTIELGNNNRQHPHTLQKLVEGNAVQNSALLFSFKLSYYIVYCIFPALCCFKLQCQKKRTFTIKYWKEHFLLSGCISSNGAKNALTKQHRITPPFKNSYNFIAKH